MSITAAGVGSGLDIEGIVSQLMELERIPLGNIETQKLEYETQLSAYGQLKSAISSFRSSMSGLASMDAFKLFSTSSSNSDAVSVKANSFAVSGSYSLEVIHLAEKHKMGTTTAQSKDAQFTESMTITVNGESLTIDPLSVDAVNGATLDEIKDLINESEDNPGLTASIINVDGDQQQLVLTSEEEGYDNRIELSGDLVTTLGLVTLNEDPDLDDDQLTATSLEDTLNASLKVDNFAVTAQSNSVDEVVEGVTFTLKDIGNSQVSVSKDSAGIATAVQKFVDAYNNLQTNIVGMRSEGGPLEADNSLLSMQNKLRGILNTPPQGMTNPTYTVLAELGITTNVDTGKLELDKTKLDKALNENFDNVAELFALPDQGFAARLKEAAFGFLDSDGLVKAREDGINARLKSNEAVQERMEYALVMKEQALRAKFANLDALLGGMQSMSNYLGNALSGLQSNNN